MSHLIKPLAFRAGKTRLWQYNKLLNFKAGSSFIINSGLNQLSKNLLKRKRLYFVKGTIFDYKNKKLLYKLLYSPKIKTKTPREHSSGAFLRRSTFKPYDWGKEIEEAKLYVYRRYEKIAKMPRRAGVMINKWLSRRMFRGASKIIWKNHTQNLKVNPVKNLTVAHLVQKKSPLSAKTESVREELRQRFILKLGTSTRKKHLSVFRKSGGFKFFKPPLKLKFKLSRLKFIKKFYKKYKVGLNRYKRWTFDKKKTRRFNNRVFSSRLSKILNSNVSVQAFNIFSYLVAKNMLSYKTHQRHIWNYRYRKFRFRYANYYDIINAFFIISLIKNSENFLFSILKVTLPVLTKLRPFLKFLNIVIKHMTELEGKYKVFRINVAGKLAGGTKRTKFQSIGYGTLPVQSLALDASNNFLSFTHLYGEFGLKILMCRNHSKYAGTRRWR